MSRLVARAVDERAEAKFDAGASAMYAASVRSSEKECAMKVLVHDNVKTPHQPRIDYLTERLTEMLGRFDSAIHRVDVTLTVEGHNGAAVSHCHVAAELGSLGAVVGDWTDRSEHHAFQGAVARLMRGIARRIAKLQTKRRGVESAAQKELAISEL